MDKQFTDLIRKYEDECAGRSELLSDRYDKGLLSLNELCTRRNIFLAQEKQALFKEIRQTLDDPKATTEEILKFAENTLANAVRLKIMIQTEKSSL